jgi:hypothetical protein
VSGCSGPRIRTAAAATFSKMVIASPVRPIPGPPTCDTPLALDHDFQPRGRVQAANELARLRDPRAARLNRTLAANLRYTLAVGLSTTVSLMGI